MSEQRLGMVVDLALCIGCNACAVACKQENDVPLTKFNTWVESWDVDDGGRIRRANLPKLCNHCANPACVHVCPTGASYVDADGSVQIDVDKCIGCKYCMAACPYGVRVQLHSGVVEKCRFCWYEGEPGNPPACVGTCITGARIFGDLDDPESEISKAIARSNAQPLASNLTESKIYYVR